MDGLISLICLYLWGTVIVVVSGIVLQRVRNRKSEKQKAESEIKNSETSSSDQ